MTWVAIIIFDQFHAFQPRDTILCFTLLKVLIDDDALWMIKGSCYDINNDWDTLSFMPLGFTSYMVQIDQRALEMVSHKRIQKEIYRLQWQVW